LPAPTFALPPDVTSLPRTPATPVAARATTTEPLRTRGPRSGRVSHARRTGNVTRLGGRPRGRVEFVDAVGDGVDPADPGPGIAHLNDRPSPTSRRTPLRSCQHAKVPIWGLGNRTPSAPWRASTGRCGTIVTPSRWTAVLIFSRCGMSARSISSKVTRIGARAVRRCSRTLPTCASCGFGRLVDRIR
jgi:hypothetical protein